MLCVTLLAALCVARFGALGCAPARTPEPKLLPHHVTLYIAISEQVDKDDRGNLAAMVETLEADLEARGRQVRVVGARLDEAAPVPRLELLVISSTAEVPHPKAPEKLEELLRPEGVAKLVMDHRVRGKLVVDAYLVRSDASRLFLGRVQTDSNDSVPDWDVIAAGELAGHAIAKRALE